MKVMNRNNQSRITVTHSHYFVDRRKFSIFDLRIFNIKFFAIHFHHSFAFNCFYVTLDLIGLNILIYLTLPDYRK